LFEPNEALHPTAVPGRSHCSRKWNRHLGGKDADCGPDLASSYHVHLDETARTVAAGCAPCQHHCPAV